MTFSFDDSFGMTIVAASVFVLYAATYGLIYRHFKSKLSHRRSSAGRRLITAVLVLAVLFAGVAGGAITLILLFSGVEYVRYVLASASGALVAFVLALATALVVRCFGSATERVQIAGQALTLSGLFWLGLAFLALYHVLWVVYVLLLTTLWPLKVITPK